MNKLLTLFVLPLLLVSTATSAANNKPARNSLNQANLAEQLTALPDVIQEILMDAKPLENSSENETFSKSEDDFSSSSKELDFSAYSSTISLAKLGLSNGIEMTAGQKHSGTTFTLPIDKVAVNSKLELYISLTEDMARRAPHLDVKINGQSLGILPLTETELTSYELAIPAELLSQDNSLSFEVTNDDELACMIDYSGDYKIIINPESYLEIDGYRIEIDSDLSLFPLPFLDNFDSSKTTVNYVFAKQLDKRALKAAMMLSSYFGMKADYKGVQFNVRVNSTPRDNAIIFGAPGQVIAGIKLPEEEGVYIQSNPYYKPFKYLFIVAKTERKFIEAVYQLVEPVIANTQNFVDPAYRPIVKRTIRESEPYDAPRWLPTNRKVYLHELLKNNQSLVTRGIWHDALNLSFRAAPDLYQLYDGQGDLFIKYEFPLDKNIDENASGLNVSLSGNYIDKLPVNKKGLLESIWRMSGGDARQTQTHLIVDPNMIYGHNDLDLYFDLRLKKDTPCNLLQDNSIKSVIDESSYIDLSQTVHFARLPNLSFFVGSSFPFTKNADFNETAVLLPENPLAGELKTLFDLSARAGLSTGTMLTNQSLYIGNNVFDKAEQRLENKDLLVISTLERKDYLNNILKNSAFEFRNGELNIFDYGIFSVRGGFFKGIIRFLSGDFRPENVDANRYVRTSSSWRGFLGLISPFDSSRTAVVVTATSDDEMVKLSDDLDNPSVNKAVGGDITLISGIDKVSSYHVGDYIYSGNVSSYFKIMQFAGEHVLWLASSSFIVILLLSAIISGFLRKRAQRRLDGDDNE